MTFQTGKRDPFDKDVVCRQIIKEDAIVAVANSCPVQTAKRDVRVVNIDRPVVASVFEFTLAAIKCDDARARAICCRGFYRKD